MLVAGWMGIVKLSCYLPDFGNEQQGGALQQILVPCPGHQPPGSGDAIVSPRGKHRYLLRTSDAYLPVDEVAQ
jgi:hypothetical protein